MRNAKKSELILIPKQNSGSFTLKEQYVCFDKDYDQLQRELSLSDYECFIGLYNANRKNLNKSIEILLKLKNKYPHSSEIYNLLSYFYIRKRKAKKADLIIKENYKTNPDNLLAKINYADYLLRKKKFLDIKEIFNNKYDLRDLYPEKSTFHITEFRGFMVLMGLYHLAIKKTHEAECFHYLITRIDKNHQQVKFLRHKLFHKSFLKKFFEKLNITLKIYN
jgi:tetratricopeptide (TPR) repeat protein